MGCLKGDGLLAGVEAREAWSEVRTTLGVLETAWLPSLRQAATAISSPEQYAIYPEKESLQELRLRLRAAAADVEQALSAFLLKASGLTLTFDSRLHRFDPTAFDAFIAEVLGVDTDVTIEERSNIDSEGPAYIRINGSSVEDLVAVAEAFYDRVWRGAEATENGLLPRGTALLVRRLDGLRDTLAEVRETVGILGNPDVQETLEDQGAAHILAKDKKLLQTRFQRIAGGVAREVKRRTVKEVIDAVQGEVEDGVAGFLGDGDDTGEG